MEQERFDRMTRGLADAVSRRSVIRRMAGGAVATAVGGAGVGSARADGKDKGEKGGKDDRNRGNDAVVCAGGGGPCGENRDCCPGLLCLLGPTGGVCGLPGVGGQAGPGPAVTDQTVTTNNQVCAGNCAQSNVQEVQTVANDSLGTGAAQAASVAFRSLPAFRVDIDCAFDGKAYRTLCTATSRGPDDGPTVDRINLVPGDICAVVIDQQSKPGRKAAPAIPAVPAQAGQGGSQASAGNGGVANAEANGGSVSIGDVNSGDNQGGSDNTTNVSVSANGGVANANASGGSGNVAVAGGGNAVAAQAAVPAVPAEPSVLTITLDGRVVPGRQTTYLLDTDAGRYPATGPSLVQTADEPAGGTGSVLATVIGCDATPAADADWFSACGNRVSGLMLELADVAGTGAAPASVTSNGRGEARFPDLAPGTYHLTPTNGAWCHAESDSVDPQGNVVVSADASSNVWLFVCPATPGGS